MAKPLHRASQTRPAPAVPHRQSSRAPPAAGAPPHPPDTACAAPQRPLCAPNNEGHPAPAPPPAAPPSSPPLPAGPARRCDRLRRDARAHLPSPQPGATAPRMRQRTVAAVVPAPVPRRLAPARAALFARASLWLHPHEAADGASRAWAPYRFLPRPEASCPEPLPRPRLAAWRCARLHGSTLAACDAGAALAQRHSARRVGRWPALRPGPAACARARLRAASPSCPPLFRAWAAAAPQSHAPRTSRDRCEALAPAPPRSGPRPAAMTAHWPTGLAAARVGRLADHAPAPAQRRSPAPLARGLPGPAACRRSPRAPAPQTR